MKTFRSLRNANYRLYAAGTIVTNIGTWIQRIAQDWLVLHLATNGGTAVGITTGLQFLPFLLLAPVAGALADRFPKRKILIYARVGTAVTALTLGLLDVTGVVQVWHVFALAFVLGVADALANPSRQAFVSEMVEKQDVTNAVALNSASFNGARIIGPAVAGLLIGVIGTGPVIMLDALLSIGTIWALASMNTSKLTPSEPQPRGRGMTREGFAYVRGRPDLLLLLSVVFFAGCFGMNFQITSALMATEVFEKGSGEFGALASVMAIGSVLGALRAASNTTARLRSIVIGALVFGAVSMVSGAMPGYLSFMVVLPLVGFFSLTMVTTANAYMQLTVPPEVRGRAMAVYAMVFVGSKPLGAPVIGWIGDVMGARWTLYLGGLACVLGALLALVVFARPQCAQAVREFREAGANRGRVKIVRWSSTTSSATSNGRRRGWPMSRRKVLARRSRRARAGRSVTR